MIQIIQILIGFALCLVFFLCLLLSFILGYRTGKTTKDKPIEALTEQEKFRIKKLNEGFKNVMNYDLNTAMGLNKGVIK